MFYWFLINHWNEFNLFFFIVVAWDASFAHVEIGVVFIFDLVFSFSGLSDFIKFLLEPKTYFIKFFSFLWWIFFDCLFPNLFKRHIRFSSSSMSSLIETFIQWFPCKLFFTLNRNQTSHSSISIVSIYLNAIIHSHVTLSVEVDHLLSGGGHRSGWAVISQSGITKPFNKVILLITVHHSHSCVSLSWLDETLLHDRRARAFVSIVAKLSTSWFESWT